MYCMNCSRDVNPTGDIDTHNGVAVKVARCPECDQVLNIEPRDGAKIKLVDPVAHEAEPPEVPEDDEPIDPPDFPTRDNRPAPRPVPPPPPPPPALVRRLPTTPARRGTTAAPASDLLIAQLRERLALVQGEIARLDGMKAEERKLRAMLRAAERAK